MSKLTNKLDFWITNNFNVLFEGSHGIGKTAIVQKAFDDRNITCKYFSAATMDPWVDLIGVPKEKTDADGTSYLELIRPKEFQNGEIEAIFFDEFNRAPAKVRNAVMELIQFKSINGNKFKNLRMVWAAVNPADEEETYNVEELDPAQRDRFQIYFKLPEIPNLEYFQATHGADLGSKAVDWWINTLPDMRQKEVSPRRLDYAIDVYTRGGDIADVLPPTCAPGMLKRVLEDDIASLSHADYWKSNPVSYMSKMLDRKRKPDNVADAFEVLHDISKDLFSSYCYTLTPAKTEAILKRPRIRRAMIYGFKSEPTASKRKITSAIQRLHKQNLDINFSVFDAYDSQENTMIQTIAANTKVKSYWKSTLDYLNTATAPEWWKEDGDNFELVVALAATVEHSLPEIDILMKSDGGQSNTMSSFHSIVAKLALLIDKKLDGTEFWNENGLTRCPKIVIVASNGEEQPW